jgi:hypothetical protein
MTRWRAVGGGLVFAVLLLAAACDVPRDPIIVDEGIVTVENLTGVQWRNVRITVNDHFSGGAAMLEPGGRMTAPLSQFQTGLGQKFDRGRQSVFKVEVTATDPDGKAVNIKWDPNARR